MAISVLFTPPSMTADQYDEITRQLEQAGVGAPAARLYHICFGTGDKMRVQDIWNSVEEFQQFGGTLMPILQKLGIDPGQPEVTPAYNIITGR